MTDTPSMSPSPPQGNWQPPGRTPEQQDAVRRKSLPVSIGGALCGVLGIVLGVTAEVSAYHPPSILAINLAFCAILIGVGILIYAWGTPRTGWAAVVSLGAILMGLSGTAVYARKSVLFRGLCESRELDNLTDIAGAARKYASLHHGVYPADILVLLEGKLIQPENLQSPYGTKDSLFNHFDAVRAQTKSRDDLLKTVETRADYIYLGDGLKDVPASLEGSILVAASSNVVLHEGVSLAFADSKSQFCNVDDIGPIREKNDAAREKMGLGPMQLPSSIQSAINVATDQKKGG